MSGVAALVLGLLIGLITLRTRGPAFIISTIALLLMVRLWFDNWHVFGGSNGLEPAAATVPGVVGQGALLLRHARRGRGLGLPRLPVRQSKFGLGLRAIAQDETKAEVAGIDTRMYRILAFAVSVFWIAVVRSLWG